MKAVIYTDYGNPSVLRLAEVEKPTPTENQVLVQVRVVNVNYGDVLARKFGVISKSEFNMPSIFWLPVRIDFGYKKPRRPILGNEFAGIVEDVGKTVTRFKKGDKVFGYRAQAMGCTAEYVCMPEGGLIAPMPANVSYEEAATIPYGWLNALKILAKVNIQPGQRVLVNGASGSIGAAAVQLAKIAGASVTGVCATPRLDMVKALGVEEVIDYTKEDFAERGKRYDVILDVLGRHSFARSRQALTEHGRYLLASFKLHQVFQMLWTSRMSKQKVICAMTNYDQKDLAYLATLVEQGQYKAIVDRRFQVAEAAEAHHYFEAGQKKGNVVLMVG